MRAHADVTIAQAAQSLGIGSRRLFQLLRQRGLLSANNIAQRQYVDAGYLRNEHRSHYLPGTKVQRWYTVPLVTGSGMALLQELIDAMAADGTVVVAERQRPPRQRRPDRKAADLQRLGATSGSTRAMASPRRND